jgi:hypothetical protein
MESNRFDDVETRIVDEPGEPRAPRRRPPGRVGPAVLAVTAALALTGSLAAGASALTSTAQAPTRVVEQTRHVDQRGHHGLCHKGEARRPSAAALSY